MKQILVPINNSYIILRNPYIINCFVRPLILIILSLLYIYIDKTLFIMRLTGLKCLINISSLAEITFRLTIKLALILILSLYWVQFHDTSSQTMHPSSITSALSYNSNPFKIITNSTIFSSTQ